jgi:AcrR family transcriptional regulator
MKQRFKKNAGLQLHGISESGFMLADDGPISTEEKEEKRQWILKAATKVFSEKGYYRTTVNDVTRAAAISTGTFYFYFQDKRQLYNDVVNDLIKNISDKREEVLQGETDIMMRVAKRGRAIYEHYDKYKEIIYLVRAEIDGDDEWAKKKAMELYQTISESLMRDLRMGIDQGLIRDVDTKLTAYSLIGLIEIMTLFMNLEHGYNIDHIMDFLFDFVLKGLEPRHEVPPRRTTEM